MELASVLYGCPRFGEKCSNRLKCELVYEILTLSLIVVQISPENTKQ